MAESLVMVTEGSGKKLHTFQRTIGANNVEDEVVILGEQYLATYVIVAASSVSVAAAADHVLQIMAGASLNVYLRRLRAYQTGLATTAAITGWSIFRLSTAGTGGTAITPNPMDTSDAASGATAMTLPTAKGTEGVRLGTVAMQWIQTVGTGGNGLNALVAEWDFDKLFRGKPPRIAAGVANGIAIKNNSAVAGASVVFEAIITEANF